MSGSGWPASVVEAGGGCRPESIRLHQMTEFHGAPGISPICKHPDRWFATYQPAVPEGIRTLLACAELSGVSPFVSSRRANAGLERNREGGW